MAPISGFLTVTFISNYAGDHRVCWRTGGTGAYDCSTTVTCVGSGASCHVDIAISVDQETCDPVVYDGYVQAICEAIGSVNGRIPFTVTFTPDPTCASYMILCNAVGVADITLDNVGSGYTPGATISSPITGGGGSLATAEVVIGDGGIKTFTITNGGTLYADGSYLSLTPSSTSGSGTDALFNVTVTGGIVVGVAFATNDLAPGTGYAISDTFTFSDAQLGALGTGSGLIITVDSINTGEVQYATLTSAGSGYSSQAIVTIPPPVSGVQALATLIMEDCDAFTITDCNGDESASFLGISVSEHAIVCASTVPSLPTGYVVTTDGCCYDCTEVEFVVDEAIDLTYTDCYTREMVTINLRSETFTQCMVTGSYYFIPEDANTVVTVGASCTGVLVV